MSVIVVSQRFVTLVDDREVFIVTQGLEERSSSAEKRFWLRLAKSRLLRLHFAKIRHWASGRNKPSQNCRQKAVKV